MVFAHDPIVAQPVAQLGLFALVLDPEKPRADMPDSNASLSPKQYDNMIEISQEFGFDAAHYLSDGAAQNRRMHGHSFYAEVTLRGQPNPTTGFLRDFGEVDAALSAIRASLDHRLLNDVQDLGLPTLENLARYIYDRAKSALPEVVRVKLRRPSYGQTCVYEG